MVVNTAQIGSTIKSMWEEGILTDKVFLHSYNLLCHREQAFADKAIFWISGRLLPKLCSVIISLKHLSL